MEKETDPACGMLLAS